MPEKVVPGPVQDSACIREAVCIPLSHYSPVAHFAWLHFFDKLQGRTCKRRSGLFLSRVCERIRL